MSDLFVGDEAGVLEAAVGSSVRIPPHAKLDLPRAIDTARHLNPDGTGLTVTYLWLALEEQVEAILREERRLFV